MMEIRPGKGVEAARRAAKLNVIRPGKMGEG